ncbi:MAG TPA: hypothetical protein VGL42_13335 [Opitutaceae bacterium]|jgi:hypothetical protein
MQKFIIYSLGRSGSSSLTILVNELSGGACLAEPFNTGSNGEKYRALALSQGLPTALKAIHTEGFAGFKHVWDPRGWPFPDRSTLNSEVLAQNDYSVIFLYRRNILRRLLSWEIGNQTKVWQVHNSSHKKRRHKHTYTEINTAHLREELEVEKAALEAVKADLTRRTGPYLKICYEDVFSPDQTSALRELRRVLDFIGLPTKDYSDRKLGSLWSAGGEGKSEEVYRLIPGIDRLNSELGSAETGFLFEPPIAG